MLKVAAVVWIILGTTLAGTAMAVIVAVPELSANAAALIPLLCGGAFLVAMPLSLIVAKRIEAATRPAV